MAVRRLCHAIQEESLFDMVNLADSRNHPGGRGGAFSCYSMVRVCRRLGGVAQKLALPLRIRGHIESERSEMVSFPKCITIARKVLFVSAQKNSVRVGDPSAEGEARIGGRCDFQVDAFWRLMQN